MTTRKELAEKKTNDTLLRGLKVHLLLGGNGSISYTERTILRKMADGQFMLSEAESEVQETTANVIAIDPDEVEQLVKKIKALEEESQPSFRCKYHPDKEAIIRYAGELLCSDCYEPKRHGEPKPSALEMLRKLRHHINAGNWVSVHRILNELENKLKGEKK